MTEPKDRKTIKDTQLKLLKSLIPTVYKKSSFYKKKYSAAKVDISSIKKVEDITKLPFTTKDDLVKNSQDFIINKDIAEWHMTGGTTGAPTIIGWTKNDLNVMMEIETRNQRILGTKKGEIFLNTLPYGMFWPASLIHNAAMAAGASVVPAGKTETMEQQISLMKLFKPNVIVGIPQFVLRMAYSYEEITGISAEKSSVKKLYVIGEPVSDKLRKTIENAWGAELRNGYGLSEICGSVECYEKNGVHWHEDHVLAEIIDPKTGEALEDGEGELVLTSLTKDGTVVIRYRSGDNSKIIKEPCSCGSVLIKIMPPKYRIDDLVKIRGTLVSPYIIDEVMLQIPNVQNYLYVISKDDKTLRDNVAVYIEISRMSNYLTDDISKKLKAATWIKPDFVKIVPLNSIPKIGIKMKRFVDLRKDEKLAEILKNLGS